MKKRLIAIACAVTIGLLPASAQPIRATTEDIAADAVLVRPMCFVATLLGSVCFVVTLPFTAPCHGVQAAHEALVARPAHATFIRELGDLNALSDE
jgi:hypothetical protein